MSKPLIIQPTLAASAGKGAIALARAHPGAALSIPVGALLLFLLQRNRDVHPTKIYGRRGEGHIRMDAGKYDHLYRGIGGF